MGQRLGHPFKVVHQYSSSEWLVDPGIPYGDSTPVYKVSILMLRIPILSIWSPSLLPEVPSISILESCLLTKVSSISILRSYLLPGVLNISILDFHLLPGVPSISILESRLCLEFLCTA